MVIYKKISFTLRESYVNCRNIKKELQTVNMIIPSGRKASGTPIRARWRCRMLSTTANQASRVTNHYRLTGNSIRKLEMIRNSSKKKRKSKAKQQCLVRGNTEVNCFLIATGTTWSLLFFFFFSPGPLYFSFLDEKPRICIDLRRLIAWRRGLLFAAVELDMVMFRLYFGKQSVAV